MISLDNGATFVDPSELSEEMAARVAADMRAAAAGSQELAAALEAAHSAGAEGYREFIRSVDEIFPGYVLPLPASSEERWIPRSPILSLELKA